MPKLRSRHESATDTDVPTDLISTSSRRQRARIHKPRRRDAKQYQHFAGAVRQPRTSPCVDHFPEADPASFLFAKGLAAVTLLVCFGASPDVTLRLLVLAETIIFAFPPYFSRWPVLMAMLFPIGTKYLLQIVVGLAVFSWVSRLDWAYASGRIHRWIKCAGCKDIEKLGTGA